MTKQANTGDSPPDEAIRSRVGYVVRRFNQAIRGQVENGLRPLGLTASQYAVLSLLERHEGANNARIAEVLSVTPQTMTRILAGLEDAGLIVRDVSGHHARVRPARLTSEGQELVARAHPVVEAAEDRLFAPLSATQRAELLDNMRKCAEALPGEFVFDGF